MGGLLYNGVHAYIEMAVGNTMLGFNKITRSAEVLIRCELIPRTTTAYSAAPAALEAKLAAAV